MASELSTAGLAAGFDHTKIIKPAKIETFDTIEVTSKPGPKTLEGFEVVPVEVSWLPISEKIRAMILTGEGVEDRSAMLLPISQSPLALGSYTHKMKS